MKNKTPFVLGSQNITIEIEDQLHKTLNYLIEEVEALLLRYLEEKSPDKYPDLYNDLVEEDLIKSIAFDAFPVDPQSIKNAWFLYECMLVEAYNSVGIGDDPRECDGMTAIGCYLIEGVKGWYYENAEIITKEFIADNPDKYEEVD